MFRSPIEAAISAGRSPSLTPRNFERAMSAPTITVPCDQPFPGAVEWEARVPVAHGTANHVRFWLHPDADEEQAKRWAFDSWHPARRGPQGQWLSPDLTVERVALVWSAAA